MSKVSCIVVTFNKVELLKENIEALLNQTEKIETIMVIDNASTDETEDVINDYKKKYPQISYYKLEKNVGGAGGFNFGMKKAYELTNELIWIMDDDTIPSPTALEELLNVSRKNDSDWGFLSSDVRWTDGSACIMNIPKTAAAWNENVDRGLIGIESGTFVSLLFNRQMLKKVGLPIKEFFIWSDDIEFTRRISVLAPSYFVSASKVVHKMATNNDTNIFQETDVNRIPRYFYSFRNKLFMERKEKKLGFLRYILSLNVTVIKLLFSKSPFKIKKIRTIYKGLFAGIFFNPIIEQVDS